jgi:hypothetical protein
MYKGFLNEPHLGIVPGRGAEAIKIAPMDVEVGISLMHQPMHLLHKEFAWFVLESLHHCILGISCNLNLCPLEHRTLTSPSPHSITVEPLETFILQSRGTIPACP